MLLLKGRKDTSPGEPAEIRTSPGVGEEITQGEGEEQSLKVMEKRYLFRGGVETLLEVWEKRYVLL